MQTLLVEHLAVLRKASGVHFRTVVEQRMRVREGYDRERRYRIPDVMILAHGHRTTGVTLDPPLVTVEILSPDDSLSELVAKSQEYIAFGVAVPVVADPYSRRVYVISAEGEQFVADGQVRFQADGAELSIDFNALFAELDL